MKWTNSQNLVLQGFLSIVGAAIVGFGQAAFQYIFTANNGHIDYRAALAFALTAFGVIFANALKQYIPAHADILAAAGNDTRAQIQAGFEDVANRLTGQAVPPVINVAPPIVNVPAPVVTVPPAPAPTVIAVSSPVQAPASPAQEQQSVSETPITPMESVPQVPFPAQPSDVGVTPHVQTLNIPQQSVLQNATPVSTYDFSQGQFVPQSVPGTASPDDTIRIAAVGK